MAFCWVTVHVSNMEESLKFYERIIGLPLNNRVKVGSTRELAFLGKGDTQVELVCDGKAVSFGPDISLGFTVDSVDEKIQSLKAAGVSIHSSPVQPNPYIRFFYVLDPNGLKIQFVENIKV